MVAEYYGQHYPLDQLRENCFITREGVNLFGISQAAEVMGFFTVVGRLSIDDMDADFTLPAILHWDQEHFVVLYAIKEGRRVSGRRTEKKTMFIIGDPAHGIVRMSREDFLKHWQSNKAGIGIGLFLAPGEGFGDLKTTKQPVERMGFLMRYLLPFRRQVGLIGGYMVLITAIGISFPYLTKGLVDRGIGMRSHQLILLFTVSQLILFLSSTVFEIFRSRLLLKVNSRISIRIVSDFLKKLLKLPIRFFDSRSVGDIAQRINDHHRIEAFLTGDAINSIFSVIQILTFSFILLSYSLTIWAVFASLSVLGVLWILLFQKKRKELDYIRFGQNKLMQEKLYEMVVGMEDIKLNGSEEIKKSEWEALQQKVYVLNKRSLQLDQYRQTGFSFLTYFKNIIISYLAAVSIIDSRLSLGEMLSISFIIGQTNGPLNQLVEFFKSIQDAGLSLERLQEVHQKEDEEKPGSLKGPFPPSEDLGIRKVTTGDILLQNVSFQYQGPLSSCVLKDIDLRIPGGKVTAIVGASGSGKTTLLKLLLGFYAPTKGRVMVGDIELSTISPAWWRTQCGTVMQDGYIFYDSILRNICLHQEEIDELQFSNAVAISRVDEFASDLPLGYSTRIGSSGISLSGGQKQRILIARALYRSPPYLFFDEATSSLDAHNERGIMENLQDYFENRTVVIIAHRLSTVKKADKIIVLDKGKIIEEGTHLTLSSQKKKYFELIKDQLELGA